MARKIALGLIILCCLCSVSAFAIPVKLELLLLVDVSGSVSTTEYNLQKTGYVNAFNNSTIQAAIAASPGGIAAAFGEWSGASQQSMLVNWTHLTDAASATAFATAIAGSNRLYSGVTAPGSAINWGVPLFNNSYEGTYKTIDVSGDGARNDGADTFNAATAAYAAGITVNGLAILGESGLQTWYQNNIATPGHGTLWIASDFASFGTAVQAKIGEEIDNPGGSDVPEPATLLLLGTGLAGIGLAAWRRKK